MDQDPQVFEVIVQTNDPQTILQSLPPDARATIRAHQGEEGTDLETLSEYLQIRVKPSERRALKQRARESKATLTNYVRRQLGLPPTR